MLFERDAYVRNRQALVYMGCTFMVENINESCGDRAKVTTSI